MPARNRKGLSENTRERIKTSMIVNRLTDHILSKEGLLNASQVTAALGLIKKTLPDLQAMTLQAEVVNRDARDMSDSELASIASSGSAGNTEQKDSEKEPNNIH